MKTIYSIAGCLFFSLKLLAAPYLYVACPAINVISVVDLGKDPQTLTDTISSDLFTTPVSFAIFPNGRKAYIANRVTSGDEIGYLLQVDIADNNQVQGPSLSLGAFTNIITISPNGKYAFITNGHSDDVSVVDLVSYSLTKNIQVGTSPVQVAFSLDGKFSYVTNAQDNDVTIIDITTLQALPNTISVGNTPIGIAITPDGQYAYVVNSGSSPRSFSVIDLTTSTQIPGSPFSLPGATAPQFVSITPDGTKAYITDNGSNNPAQSKVYVVSTKNQAVSLVADPLSTFQVPSGVLCSSDGKQTYVANRFSNTISVIDNNSDTVTNTITVDDGPYWLGITPTYTLAEFLKNTRFSRVSIQKGNL